MCCGTWRDLFYRYFFNAFFFIDVCLIDIMLNNYSSGVCLETILYVKI